jgi:hypothetical protein
MKAPRVTSEEFFAVLFRRPGLQPLKKCFPLPFRSHSALAATLDEGPV